MLDGADGRGQRTNDARKVLLPQARSGWECWIPRTFHPGNGTSLVCDKPPPLETQQLGREGTARGRGGPAARSLPEDIVSGLPEVSPEGALVNPVAMSGTGRLKQHNCVCVSIMGCSLLLGSHGGPGVSTEITVIGGKNRDISLKGHQPAKVKAV